MSPLGDPRTTTLHREGGSALTIGVDEAGRGAVLGPLVLAACALTPAAESRLRALGVQDSKRFGSQAQGRTRRRRLSQAIEQEATWFAIEHVAPRRVDEVVWRNGLNRLEQDTAATLLHAAPPYGALVLDGARLFGPLANRLPRAEARNRADQDVLAVAAASILAKVARDRAFEDLSSRYADAFGPIRGGGYPNAATAVFLEAYFDRHAQLPPETRRSWRWPPVATRVMPHEQRGPLPLPFDVL